MNELICVNNLMVFSSDIEGKDHGVSFSLFDHELLLVLGENGVGKTTTVKILANILDIGNKSTASVHIDHEEVCYIEEQSYFPFENVKVKDLLCAAAAVNGISENDFKKNKEFLDAYLDVEFFQEKEVRFCSKGMRQRVFLMMALLPLKKIILLDEPLNGLDKESVKLFLKLIEELKKRGHGLVMISHNYESIIEISDKVLIMKREKKIYLERNDKKESYQREIIQAVKQ